MAGATDLTPRPPGTVLVQHCVDAQGRGYDTVNWALEPHWLDATHDWWNERTLVFEDLTGSMVAILATSWGPSSGVDEAKYCCDPTGALTTVLAWGPEVDLICDGPATWTWTPEDFQ
ncbi:MAG: hypothetical protein ABMB14_38630 [Myxococcota bacterium]